jgi:putative ABC transport system ATP-binding protein
VETIQLRKVRKHFETSAGTFTALDDVDLEVKRGEFLAVVGKSGSGKSTLLNMLAGIDRPSAGEVLVANTPVHTLTQDQLAAWRGKSVGVVFQFFQLLPTLTALENVILPMDFSHAVASKDRAAKAMKLLERVGVGEQAHKLPSSLSGGQQQRVAIARALANDPPLILADEPTGNLDSRTAEQVLNLFADLAASGKTVVMVTHERDVSAWVSRTVTLADGRIIKSETNPAWGKPLEVNHA